MDIITSVIFERLHRDHRFLRAKHEAVEGFFAGGGLEYMLKSIEDTSALETSISKDRNLHFISTFLLSPKEVLKYIADFKTGAREIGEMVREAYTVKSPSAVWATEDNGRVQVNLSGFVPIKALDLALAAPLRKIPRLSIEFMEGDRCAREGLPRPNCRRTGCACWCARRSSRQGRCPPRQVMTLSSSRTPRSSQSPTG